MLDKRSGHCCLQTYMYIRLLVAGKHCFQTVPSCRLIPKAIKYSTKLSGIRLRMREWDWVGVGSGAFVINLHDTHRVIH